MNSIGGFETCDMIASDFKMKFADFMTHLVVSDPVSHAKGNGFAKFCILIWLSTHSDWPYGALGCDPASYSLPDYHFLWSNVRVISTLYCLSVGNYEYYNIFQRYIFNLSDYYGIK